VDFLARTLELRPARRPHLVNKPSGGFPDATHRRGKTEPAPVGYD
jgi:hypothetical protein